MTLTNVEVLQSIQTSGILPVLRAENEDQALRLADALLSGGVTALEITMTIPGAPALLRRLSQEHPELLLGMGTVLDADTGRLCIQQGAQFIISPALDRETIDLCVASQIAVIPGVLTPSEIAAALRAGVAAVKLFPASAVGGPAYLRALRAPLPHVQIIPTGGVSLANAEEFLAAGAIALGVGADLVDLDAARAGDFAKIARRAKQYLDIVRAFRTRSPASATT